MGGPGRWRAGLLPGANDPLTITLDWLSDANLERKDDESSASRLVASGVVRAPVGERLTLRSKMHRAG